MCLWQAEHVKITGPVCCLSQNLEVLNPQDSSWRAYFPVTTSINSSRHSRCYLSKILVMPLLNLIGEALDSPFLPIFDDRTAMPRRLMPDADPLETLRYNPHVLVSVMSNRKLSLW